ncbi:uncharacterized protein BDZ99DRAFT_153048 [Mytilinidion resinicola]|uniref:Uncharacterized protein n=1 Tax=Mytilinidion resinicola TaxID=574789 RepID=A0A6A6Y701_9PEZI|nr:uncharacterized protein BDZ99DRAFT_153048 [Mytilinidion resinicola]KAF2804470.1 hypothetical protein BDZ99DRAFT_153048 [Mytilinidion resinicola]
MWKLPTVREMCLQGWARWGHQLWATGHAMEMPLRSRYLIAIRYNHHFALLLVFHILLIFYVFLVFYILLIFYFMNLK